MKKFRNMLAMALVVVLVLTAGCSKSYDNDDAAITTTLIGGNPSGVWFALSTAIAESLGRSYEGSVMHATPGNNYSNLFRINENETEFALTHSTLAYEASKGLGSFEEKLDNVGSIACFYPSIAHLALAKDIGVTTFDEIIENKIPIRISIGSSGGTGESGFEKLVSLYGITLEDMESWGCKLYRAGNSDSEELFADGQIDGMWKVTSVPTPTLTQAATNVDMVMITFRDDIVDSMESEFGYTKMTISKDAYNFMTEDYSAFTEYTILAASLDTSEEAAYKVTKSICENLEYICSVHSSLEGSTLESLVMNLGVPLHPGAEKYYREAGLID